MLTVAKLDRYDLVNNPVSDKPSFTIWFSGCTQKCPGCYNTKLWDVNSGTQYDSDDIVHTVCEQCDLTDIDEIVLLGGEPMEQDVTHLLNLVSRLNKYGYKIWMYTSWDFNDIPANIKENMYTIKCGRFDESLKCDGIPSSTNQKFYRNNGTSWEEIIFKEDKA